jgi:1,4-alpha-glucan branching enzyme
MRTAIRLVPLLLIAAVVLSLADGCIFLRAIKNRLPPPEPVKNGMLFRYEAPAARQVTLAGNFNNWGGTDNGGRYDPNIDPMSDRDDDGIWEIVVPLPPGRYQYKFVIDEVIWERDPSNPETDFEGGFENSLVVVPPDIPYDVPEGYSAELLGTSSRVLETEFELNLEGYEDADNVSVAGEFNDWDPEADPMSLSGGVWTITLGLDPGRYEYKFVVDGDWITDPANPEKVSDPYGGFNSVLTVQ